MDTAAVIVVSDRVRIRKLHWVGATVAGHVCRVVDANGERIWEAVATGANFDKESIWEEGQGADFNGFELAVINSGILYVSYQ